MISLYYSNQHLIWIETTQKTKKPKTNKQTKKPKPNRTRNQQKNKIKKTTQPEAIKYKLLLFNLTNAYCGFICNKCSKRIEFLDMRDILRLGNHQWICLDQPMAKALRKTLDDRGVITTLWVILWGCLTAHLKPGNLRQFKDVNHPKVKRIRHCSG